MIKTQNRKAGKGIRRDKFCRPFLCSRPGKSVREGEKRMNALKKIICAALFSVLCVFPGAAPAAMNAETTAAAGTSALTPAEAPPLLGAARTAQKVAVGSRGWLSFDSREFGDPDEWDFRLYHAGLGYSLFSGVSLNGSYMVQDISQWNAPSSLYGENPEAWSVALELTQQKLRFTSLWVEYASMSAGFYLPGGESAAEGFAWPFSRSAGNSYLLSDTAVVYLAARQQWNSRFSTFQQYARYSGEDSAAASAWAVGVGYQYTPGLYFELSYNDQDGALDDSAFADKRVRLRTMVSF